MIPLARSESRNIPAPPTSSRVMLRCIGETASYRPAEGIEVADGRGCQSLHRAGGNRVDADLLGAEVVGQVLDRGVEGGLANAHHVVAGDDPLAAEVGQGEDRAARRSSTWPRAARRWPASRR